MKIIPIVALIVLTGTLLSFPVNLQYSYSQLSSLSVFQGLGLFGLLFYVWMSVLVYLLLSNWRGRLNNILVLSAFIMVTLWLWVLKTPWGLTVDEPMYFAGANIIERLGHIPVNYGNYAYFSWPGTLLLTAEVSQISGLGTIATRGILLLTFDVMLGLGLYVLYRKLVFGVGAVLTIMILIMSNRYLSISSYLQGGSLTYVYLMLLFILVFQVGIRYRKINIIFGILLAGTIIAYFPAALVIATVLLATYVWPYSRKATQLPISTLILAIIIPLSWLIYYVPQMFSIFIIPFGSPIGILKSLNPFNIPSVASSGLGQLPEWALLTQLFWLLFLYGGGVIAALFLIIFRQKIDYRIVSFSIPALVALIAYALLSLVAYPSGSQVSRFQQYAPFFLVPAILYIIIRFSTKIQVNVTKVLAVFFIIILLISLPTFLVNSKTIASETVYPTDYSVYQTIAHWNQTSLNIYQLPTTRANFILYLPNLSLYHSVTGSLLFQVDEKTAISGVAELVDSFHNSRSSVFVLSSRDMGEYLSFGTNSSQVLISLQVLNNNDVVYSDGVNQMYYA